MYHNRKFIVLYKKLSPTIVKHGGLQFLIIFMLKNNNKLPAREKIYSYNYKNCGVHGNHIYSIQKVSGKHKPLMQHTKVTK